MSNAIPAADAIRRWRERPSIMVRELFQTEPDEWQVEALDSFPSKQRMALKACAGPGKLESFSTIVETPTGPRRWGDLKAGDLLFAEDGTPTRIVQTFPHGVKPIFRVTFDDGSYARVGGEHLWKVRGRTERRHWKMRNSADWTPKRERRALAQEGVQTPSDGYAVLTTEQIIERGVMTVNRSCPAKQFEIPIQGAVVWPAADLPIDPYVLGVWIGDGSKAEACYTKPYIEVEHEVQRRGYETRRDADGKTVKILKARKAFERVECFHRGSFERFIPELYKRASIQQRTDLLCGLMDTDGCIGDDSHMEYDTTSEALANDVVWLVRSLGGVALIKSAIKAGWYRNDNGEKVECRDCYRVTVRLPFNPFRIHHKAKRWVDPARSPQSLRYLTRYIASIEPDGEEEAMCVEIDHSSHCYLTRDFIVTHNTAVLAWLGWNFMLTRPHPMVGCTSISGDNLKTALWTEFARWRAKSPLLMEMFEQTKSEIFAKEAPRTWRMEARTWAKDADASQIGNALAGIHAQHVMWLLDETGDYPDSIMPVCEGIFNGNPQEAHIVQAGNPTRRAGPLYRACTVARKLWKVIEITADPDDPKRTPRVSVQVARDQIEQYGRENPWVRVRIFGEFPDSDFNALIGPDEVSAAMKKYYREGDIGTAPLVLGIDVARFGDDSSVIFPRRGIQAFPFKKYRNLDSTQGSGIVARYWEEQKVDGVFIDNAGLGGGGWIDALRRLGRQPVGIDFGSSPRDKGRYLNKRAEMYFDAVEWIKRGGALPESPELLAALTQTTYSFSADSGRLQLEPKDMIKRKLGYSPDEADAFVLTFAETVSAPKGQIGKQQHLADYDPFRLADSVQASYDPFKN